MDKTQESADPVAIVEQMKTLTDIEGDLAETALAVQATDPAVLPETAAETGSGDVTAPTAAADAFDAAVQQDTLQTAEAVENVLENAIPPGPEQSAAAAASEPISTSGQPHVATEAQDNVSTIDAAAPSTQSDSNGPPSTLSTQQPEVAASQVQELVQVVAADVNNPILPSTDPATGIPSGDPKEESVTSVQADVSSARPLEGSHPDPAAQFSTDPQFLEDAKEIPSQTPYQSLEAPHHDVDLPAGLTSASASVSENAHLINLWKRDPKDPRTILELFEFSVQRTEAPDARAWYHTLSEIEPAAVKPLLALINLELSLSNFSEVETLFGRALKGTGGDITAAADVSIWKAYLHYIRRQNPIAEGATNVEQVRSTITKAYEFALQQCGTDRESGDVWQEYISFLSEANPKNTWETQQQMDNLRKVYQRAVCIPLNNVEALWKAYDAFESGLNKLTAKKFLAERSPAYMTARTALRELRALTEGLPHPSLPPQPDYSEHDRSIVNLWKSFLRWEESNPLVIEDQSVLNSRVKYALRQCLGDMRHFPELWHYAANWHIQAGRKDDAAEVLKAGVDACPHSFLLTFALADLEEDRGKFATCHEIYEALLNRLIPEIVELKTTVAAEVDRARGPEVTRPTGEDAMNGDDGLAEVTRMIDEREARGRHVAERRGKDVDELSTAASVVWIMYMRFARRAEGIKAARGIFGKARKSPHITWHTFEASAMMEYHSNKDPAVAIRIFELGFKVFSEDVDYVVRYLQFLLSVNDDSNARALFERSAPKIPAEEARPLWDTWARYEYMYGDLSGVHKLEARFSEVFPHDSPLKRFAQRFIYNGIDQVALRDLGFGRRQAAPAPTPAAVEPKLPPPPASLPPIPAMPSRSPPQKRRYPDRSPQTHGRPRGSIDRSQSPSAKRYRPASPPRRYPLPERERVPSAGRYDERSSLPPPPGGRGSIPPHGPSPMSNMGPPRGSMPPSGDFDRSGLTRPLSWFIDSLPSARSFNGPVFRADDIMHLFSNIGRDGRGIPAGPPPPVRAAYPPPENRYGGPPPRRY